MRMDWQAVGLAVLLAIDALLLIRRFKQRGNWLIISAMMPRLYMALIYSIVAIGNLSLVDRAAYLRIGLYFLLLVEILNQIINWRNNHL